jgi:hypothetical protein
MADKKTGSKKLILLWIQNFAFTQWCNQSSFVDFFTWFITNWLKKCKDAYISSLDSL